MSPIDLIVLGFAACAAGTIDAIAGGGGLISTPTLLLLVPQAPIAAVLGTTKCTSIVGTTAATIGYARRIRFDRTVVVPGILMAIPASLLGAALVSHLDARAVKPLILAALIVVAVITWRRPTLGLDRTASPPFAQRLGIGVMLGTVLGFYDGLLGPGTGTFLSLALIAFAGQDFLQASAHARLINIATNLGAALWFIAHGNVLWEAVPVMATGNLLGGVLGSRWALLKGSAWIRRVFLLVATGLILRLAWSVVL